MEEFKTTPYIRLLSEGNAAKEDFEKALSDFTHRIYEFCMKEKDRVFIYFSLHCIRTQLIQIEEMRTETGGKLSASGGIAFVDAAIEWTKGMPRGNEESTQGNGGEMEVDAPPQIVWTGKVIHLMEFIYGSDTLKNFMTGKVTIKRGGGALRQDVRDRNQRPVGLLCEHAGTGAGEPDDIHRQHEGCLAGKRTRTTRNCTGGRNKYSVLYKRREFPGYAPENSLFSYSCLLSSSRWQSAGSFLIRSNSSATICRTSSLIRL